MKPSAFLGLRTVIYYVPDLLRAKAWYESVLGISPYYDTPYYVGFNVGGYELGLHPADDKTPKGAGGAVSYWGVTDIAASWKRLLELGAKPVHEPEEVGEGIKVASLSDPFDNQLGLIENPHFPNSM